MEHYTSVSLVNLCLFASQSLIANDNNDEEYNAQGKDLGSARIIIGKFTLQGVTSDVLNPLKNSGHQKEP